jgi:hypothetical protein
LKAWTPVSGAAGAAEIGVNGADPIRFPAQSAGALGEAVLEIDAFLILLRLLRGRLPDVNDRQAAEVTGLDAFGNAHG